MPNPTNRKLPPDDELRALIHEHGTFRAVGRLFGASGSAVALRARALGIKSPQRRGGRRRCDRCNASSEARTIERFNLYSARHRKRQFGRRSSGSILLCEACWRATAAKRRVRAGRVPLC